MTSPSTPRGLGRPFWSLWASSSLSNLADGVLKIALPLAALRFTDSPLLIAGVSLALSLPWLLFSLPAGALADRLDRRRIMLAANTARAVLAALLALSAATGTGGIWALYAVALGVGVTETLYDTSAQSILPQLVPRDRLDSANGRLHATEMAMNQFVGPPLGGLLVATGLALSLATPAALWLVAVGALLLVPGRFRVDRERPSTMGADIAEGLRYLWRHRLLRAFAAMVGISNFASSAAFAVFVLYAVGPDSPMGLAEPAYGVLLTTSALGVILGSLTASRVVGLLGRSLSMRVSAVTFVALVGVPALTADPYLVGAGFFVGGLGIAVWNVTTVSLRQRITPDHLLGRLNSGYRLLAWGTMPLGAAAGGVIAQFAGLTWVFASMGVLSAVVLVWLLFIGDADMDRAEAAASK
ncbi:MFS transporter [Nocardiopsis changdeensis]|uniref:MFS transporter n=1 Tax=Nocardiopsis changdeensis TaxID=2831969 RepID=A0ABX8BD57_9ACTN|nr:MULTISPECIES: MFS transporter [Nocardiopsis]QUX20179.1 MFS transporter [Nocardiopsis changdeensis]QYX36107.1 MFS transporter [Nocardiopsis sp. MT53]